MTIALVLVALLLGQYAGAQTLPFDYGGPGTTVMSLLRIDQGVRAAALGGSYVGRAEDASALYWNPAGLGRVTRYRLSLSHHEWFAGIRDEVLQASFPGQSGALGIGLLYSAEPGIEYWTPANTPVDTFRTWSSALSVGYGARFARRFRLGGGIKGFYNSLHTAAGWGGALDLGFGVRPLDGLELGLVGRNLGVSSYGARWYDLPAEVAVGAAWERDRFSLSADYLHPFGQPGGIRAGVEYHLAEVIALRLGFRTGPVDLATLGWHAGLSGGIGLALGALRLDYAVVPYGVLGITHRVGLDLAFPRRGSGRVLIHTVTADGLQPLSATLAFDGVHTGNATTDRLGRHELTGLVPGRLIIRTSLPGRVPRVDTMLILGDRRQHATIDLALINYGSIWVAIYDAATMQAIGGEVRYSGPVHGDQDVPENPGSAVIRDVPAGEYILEASGPSRGYLPAACTVRIEPGAVIEQRFLLRRASAP